MPKGLITLNLLADGLQERLERIRQGLLSLSEQACAGAFELRRGEKLLKSTISLCVDCLAHVPAVVYVIENRVLIRKHCPRHGLADAVLENDPSYYHLSNRDQWGRRYAREGVVEVPQFEGGCCGGGECGAQDTGAGAAPRGITDQRTNKTCTMLVELTNACNLACPVCYADAKGDRMLPLEVFKRHILEMIALKGGLDSVQLTGGEATLHPDFMKMLAFLHEQPGVKKIYLPTNGILLGRPEFAANLAPFRDRLMVLLQFDGHERQTNMALRDADTAALRDRVIENLGRHAIQMQLTMTLTKGVNEDQAGWVVDTGMKHAHVKVIALQPATYSGRYEMAPDPMHRLTVSDMVKAVVGQVKRRTRERDFVPIPCSHPNCGWITLYVRRCGMTFNIVKHVDLPSVMGRVANRTLLETGELREVVGTKSEGPVGRIAVAIGRKLIRSTDVFGVAIKPFMDRFNYDQDRISACCHHLLDTQGRPVSFCEYNALIRPTDSWERLPRLAEARL